MGAKGILPPIDDRSAHLSGFKVVGFSATGPGGTGSPFVHFVCNINNQRTRKNGLLLINSDDSMGDITPRSTLLTYRDKFSGGQTPVTNAFFVQTMVPKVRIFFFILLKRNDVFISLCIIISLFLGKHYSSGYVFNTYGLKVNNTIILFWYRDCHFARHCPRARRVYPYQKEPHFAITGNLTKSNARPCN